MSKWKYSVIMGFLGQLTDRFSTYGVDRSVAEKIEIAGQIEGVKGIEMVYPGDFVDQDETLRLMAQAGLEVSTVNVNLKAEPKFHRGSLTSRDAGVRKEAVEYMQQGMDLAAKAGCNLITMCPLADGFDYAFESDYIQAWRWMLDGVGQAAAYRSDVRVSLEYKPSETRHKTLLSNAGTSLAACLQIDMPNVGVTMDMGHALYAGEASAQAVSLLAQADRLFLVHVNDNYRNWDWDMIPGSVNFWDLIETLYVLRELDYDFWITSDVAPFRTDVVKTFSATYRMLTWAEEIIDRVGKDELHRIVHEGDAIDALMAFRGAM